MTTGSRETLRSQQERYRRNYKEPEQIILTKQDTGFDLFKKDSFNVDKPIVEKEYIATKREIKKITLIDYTIPREPYRKKTVYLGDNVVWNHNTGFGFRRLAGKIVEIIPNNLSVNNVNETIFKIRINTGAITYIRGQSLL